MKKFAKGVIAWIVVSVFSGGFASLATGEPFLEFLTFAATFLGSAVICVTVIEWALDD